MTKIRKTIAGYAALSRVSNLPTCLTNVMAGFGIGVLFWGGQWDWFSILLLFKCVGMMYVGGMAMNDVCDYGFDKAHGIDRPLTRGDVSLSGAWAYMLDMILGGAGLLYVHFNLQVFYVGLGLVLMITGYNWLHKRWAGSVWLMGACRSLVYALGLYGSIAQGGYDCVVGGSCCVAKSKGLAWVGVAVIGLYTAGITLIARMEYTGEQASKGKRLASVGMVVLGIAGLWARAVVGFEEGVAETVLVVGIGILTVYWLSRAVGFASAGGKMTKQAVLTWLSGMTLVDSVVLAGVGQTVGALVALGCFLLVLLWHRVVAGT